MGDRRAELGSCAVRQRRGWLLFLLLLACYCYFVPRSGRSDWSASARADLAMAVADRGVLWIDDYHTNTGDKAFYQGHYYAVGSIGPSLLALPAYLLIRPVLSLPAVEQTLAARDHAGHRRERLILLVMTLFAVSLPSALLGVVVYLFACRFTPRESHAFIVALTYGLATIAFPYSKALFQHQVSAFGAFVGFYLLWRVVREGATRQLLWAVGALFGLAAISEYPVAPFLVLLVLWAALEMKDYHTLHRVVWGALPLLLLFAAYNWAIFGTPLPVGYRYHVEYSMVHAQGFMGIARPTWEALYGITISPYRGLFFLSPILLLTLPGVRFMWRLPGERRTAVLLGVVIAGFILYNASYLYWWGGAAIGPRFLVPAVPFMMLPLACAFTAWFERPLGRWVIGALIGFSALNVWAQSIAGQHYPPDTYQGRIVTNPTFQYAIPVLRNGDVAFNYATAFGLNGLGSLIPLALILACLAAASTRLGDRSLRPTRVRLPR